MREILIRLLVAALLTFAAFALSSSARGQQADAAANPMDQTGRQEKATERAAPSSGAREAAASDVAARDDDQTQDAFVFNGQIVQENGVLVLMDPVTRISYQLKDQARAKPFAGRQVRVVGKLEMRSNTILVETISDRR